jgi:flagellar secretion chaperone FliS
MNQNQIATLYRQVSARGASPLTLVVKLYDIILEDLRRALDALAAGDIERRTNELNHALRAIAELQNALNHEKGGDVARRLENFYNVTRGMVIEANIRGSAELLNKLNGMYASLRSAWQQVEKEQSGQPAISSSIGASAPPSLEPRLQPQGAVVSADAEAAPSRWSA